MSGLKCKLTRVKVRCGSDYVRMRLGSIPVGTVQWSMLSKNDKPYLVKCLLPSCSDTARFDTEKEGIAHLASVVEAWLKETGLQQVTE